MEIKKVKINDKGVYIEYTRIHGDKEKVYSEEECSLGSPDAPLPEFKEALATQDKRVAWICGFKESSDIRTIGIIITEDKEGLERVSFLAEKSLPGYDQPLMLRTPPSANENVSAICAAAMDYIEGKRAQQTLDFGKEAKDAAPEKVLGKRTVQTLNKLKDQGVAVSEQKKRHVASASAN